MKARRLSLACGAVALLAVAALVAATVPDPMGAVLAILALPHAGGPEALQLAAVVTLAGLRSQHADLLARATARRAEIVAGLGDDQVRAIEADHAALLREAEGLQLRITAAENAPIGGAPPPAGPAAPAAVDQAARAADMLEIGTRAGMPAEDITAAVRDTAVTVDAFRARAFDVLHQRQAASQTTSISITRDETDTRRGALTEAIVARLATAAGQRNVEVSEAARPYRAMPLVEIAAEAIGWRGNIRTAAQVVQVMERSFLSTSDFPGIFVDALNARLLARYQAATPTYRLFCARYDAPDFRAQNIVRAGDFPTLQEVLETGEIKAGKFSESKETMQVKSYGVKFNLSRQMIINDNLSAIEQILGSSGDRVMDWENAQAFAKLAANPTLATDSVAVFATASGHTNYTSSGTAISVTSIGVGRAKMMAQSSLDGIKLNLSPASLICGPDKITEAEQIATTITPAAVANAVPEWMRRLTPAGDANISGNTWYLFADPNVAPCFVYGSLQGFPGPRLTTENVFGQQGLGVQLEHDFVVAAMDFRGGYKNAGA